MTFIIGAAAIIGAIGTATGWALGRLLRRLPFDRRLRAFRFDGNSRGDRRRNAPTIGQGALSADTGNADSPA